MTHGHRLLETREVIGLGLVATLVPLNSTMIIVALGDIGDDLDVSKGTASWLVTLYLGVMLIGQPLAGRMADRVGSGRLLTTSLAGFVAMSVVAALAPNFAFLFVARMVHAALGAAFVPVVETLLRMLSPERDRGRNFGILGSFFGVGTVAGPIVGGGVTELVGWQGIFLANIPVILVSLVLIRDVLRVAGARERGSGTSDLARVGLGSAFQWAFTTQSTTVFGQYCLLLIVPIVLDARGWSAGEVGLALTAMTVGMLVLGPVGGRLGDRGGRRLPIALGVAISTTALAVGALVIDGRVAFLIVALLVYGIGTGVALPSMRAAALDLVPDQAVGRAAGVMSMSRYAGSIPATVLIALAVSDSGANAAAVLWIAVTVSVVSLLCASLLPGRDPAPATA